MTRKRRPRQGGASENGNNTSEASVTKLEAAKQDLSGHARMSAAVAAGESVSIIMTPRSLDICGIENEAQVIFFILDDPDAFLVNAAGASLAVGLVVLLVFASGADRNCFLAAGWFERICNARTAYEHGRGFRQ